MTYRDGTSAGFKGDPKGPGAEAAQAISAQLGRRQREVYDALDRPMNAEAVAAKIDRHWYVVRPRLSELERKGLAVKTGDRGRSAFGGQSTIYRRSTAEEHSLFLARQAADAEKSGADHG